MLDLNAVARRIRSKCVDRGITYEELAEGIGVPESTLKSWIYGQRNMDFHRACDIADFLGMSLDELACRDGVA